MTKKNLTVWYGELASRGQLARRGTAILSPSILWLLILLVLPGLVLIAVSFTERGTYGEIEWIFSVENYKRLAGFGMLGWSADYLSIIGRSIWVAFITTLISVLLSYPLGFFIAKRPQRQRLMWLIVLIVPFWTNMVIRAYAWFLILAPEMPLAKFAVFIGIHPANTPLYPSSFAVYLGMVSMFLPFVALPLYSSIEGMDWSLAEAAQDLYASPVRVFRQAIFPQTVPGLTAGIILTFVPAMGMFVVPNLLGGSKFMLVGNLIQQQFGSSRDWPFGAAISMGLMILTMISLQIYRKKSKGVEHL